MAKSGKRPLILELEAAEALLALATHSQEQPCAAVGVGCSNPSSINPAAVINKGRKLTKGRHAKLTNILAHLSQENEHLNKEKDLALNHCNSLKRTNEFRKAQLDSVKKGAADQGQQHVMGNTRPGAPLLVYPAVPWTLLPYRNTCSCSRCSCSNSHQLPPNHNIQQDAAHTVVSGLLENMGPPWGAPCDDRNQDQL